MGGKKLLNVAELDCIFISYDEPNAESNWADLLNHCMWAKRVHGVKGSDAAHKEAARQSDTEWFVTVDGDNLVDPNFFGQEIEVADNICAMTWPALNSVNGLRYGNGSLKIWKKDYVLNIRTHEAADKDSSQVDFCWEKNYKALFKCYSTSVIDASPFQAWRAGFREGVKMNLVNGVLPKENSPSTMFWHNLQRLKVWMSVGAHKENGLWAILGARQGCYMTNCTDWDYVNVRDFDFLKELWKSVEATHVGTSVEYFGNLLKEKFFLDIPLLDRTTSEFVYGVIDDQYRQMTAQAEHV